MTQILVIEDEEVLARSICDYLGKKGYCASYALSGQDGVARFKRERPVMTLLDYRIGDENGLEVLRQLRDVDPEADVIMATGHGDVSLAVDAMKSGARDFLTKPLRLSEIAELAAEVAEKQTDAPTEEKDLPLIIGRSAAVQSMRQSIMSILDAVDGLDDAPPSVLIDGETGTGKDLIARTLHSEGPRASAPFISINCAALPTHLVEAELFGYEKGAFTNADAAKPGLFEAADGGVLFLDEVGDLPLETQAKLLRVLENRSVRRLGAVKDRAVNVWVLSATNRPLTELVARQIFRSDLMYRLQVLCVRSPSLRERDTDILLLAKHFMSEFAKRYGRPVPAMTDCARAALVGHAWSGNVRELRNVIERVMISCNGGTIDAATLGLAPAPQMLPATPSEASLQDVEVNAIQAALAKTGGNVSKAARCLSISRDTLRYRLEKYGLRV